MAETPQDIEILLIEDSPTDAEMSIRTLKKHKLANSLVWKKDGAEALEFLFGADAQPGRPCVVKPRVILLDLRLPKVDGLEVLRQVKSDERTRMIPVVVLTSSKEDRDIGEAYRLGVNSFISKPIEFEEFSRIIAQLGLYWLVVNKPPA